MLLLGVLASKMDEKSSDSPDNSANDSNGPALEAQSPELEGPPKLEGERSIHGIKWALTVVAILSSTFLFSLDTTVVRFSVMPQAIRP